MSWASRVVSPAAVLVAVLCGAAMESARADGEVGLVIEEEGQVRTYCVGYTGDSLSGDDLLGAAGISYEDLGTGSGAVLCAIEEVGCFDASSFSSCWCECQGTGGSDCVYWAFFTRDYGGGWVYSARAFDRTNATDGDLHAWKWGEGGPSSAPRPSDAITFESVCGHAPRGGAPPAATATSSPTAASSPTALPGVATATASAAATDTPFSTAPAVASSSPGVTVTFTAQPTSVLAPATGEDDNDDEGGGGPTALIAFGAVALGLVAAIGGAAYWRRGHGV